jgi:hypothetical protein
VADPCVVLTDPAPAATPPRARRAPRARRLARRALDLAAVLAVLAALVVPDHPDRLTAVAFARIPVEGLVAAGLVLALPARRDRAARRLAAVGGVLLGVLTLGTLLDVGFYDVLVRPFDPVLDWGLLDDAAGVLTDSVGRTATVAVVVLALVLAVALVAALGLSALRSARVVRRHRAGAARAVGVLAVGWVVCAVAGVQVAPGEPVASRHVAQTAEARVQQVVAGVQDQAAFAGEAAVDAWATTPGTGLLKGLRGKDVLIVFVESYGRSALADPELAGVVDPALDAGSRQLAAAGFSGRSAFLTSPTAGGGSVLAHSTLLSGLWIDNQQRYRNLVAGNRLTLNGAFTKAGWRSVGVMPAVTRAWPEGAFYHYDTVYDANGLGYHGPKFSYAPVPDQYTLSVLQRRELAPGGRPPVLAEVALVSSHTPWAPLPQPVPWGALGDGSVFGAMAAGADGPSAVWSDYGRIRDAYARSIAYSMSTLFSFVATYGTDRTVLVVLGDHQPAPVVTGAGAGRDVPVTIVAKDPAVLAQVSGWGWQDGVRPGAQAPLWRMDAFRDRFLAAFSGPPTPGSHSVMAAR